MVFQTSDSQTSVKKEVMASLTVGLSVMSEKQEGNTEKEFSNDTESFLIDEYDAEKERWIDDIRDIKEKYHAHYPCCHRSADVSTHNHRDGLEKR